MKTFILTLVLVPLLAGQMAWGQEDKADITGLDSLLVVRDSTAGGYTILDFIWEERKDTLKYSHNPEFEYIVEIIEKADTVWNDKVMVWLTPDEHKHLMKLLRESKEAEKDRDKMWLYEGKKDLDELKLLQESIERQKEFYKKYGIDMEQY